jgi:3-oxoadipate enol-lactonase
VTAAQFEIGAELDLAAETTGVGAPVVFVAGVGDDRHLFDSLVGRLASEVECTTFDNRGVGRSGPLAPGAGIAEMAEDAHRLAARLDRGPVTAVGCSLGSAIVQEWALAHPEDLAAVVLISTWSRADAYLEALFRHWRALAVEGDLERLGESLALLCGWPGWFEPAPDGESEGDALPPAETLVAQLDACLAHDTGGRLEEIDLPALVLAGARDQVVGPHHGAAVAAAIPGARLELTETGHVPFWERPDECAALVTGFLAEAEQR